MSIQRLLLGNTKSSLVFLVNEQRHVSWWCVVNKMRVVKRPNQLPEKSRRV